MVELGHHLVELESGVELKPGHFYVQDIRPEDVFIVFVISNTDKRFVSIDADGKFFGNSVKVFNDAPQLVTTWTLRSFTVNAPDFELGVWYEVKDETFLQKRLIKDLFRDQVGLELWSYIF